MYKSKLQLKTLDRIIPILTYRKTYLFFKNIILNSQKFCLKGKKNSTVICEERYRGTGKTIGLARLSSKYNIPLFVGTNTSKKYIDDFYMKHKRLFGFKQPNVIVADQNNSLLRRKRFSYVLIDETVKNPESIFRYCNNNYLMLINAK